MIAGKQSDFEMNLMYMSESKTELKKEKNFFF